MHIRNAFKVTTLMLAVATLAIAPISRAGEGHDHKEHEKEAKHAADGHEHGKDEKAKKVDLKGEVLDLYCFMKHPADGQGAEHAKCAMNCIKKGLPIGFLSGGEVYMIVGKDHEPVADTVAEWAGKQSRLKGTMFVHHGVKAIELESIEKI